MKKLVQSTMLLIALVALGATAAQAGVKVEICHVPPSNPANFHSITVSDKALPAHLAHGDLAGSCSANCDTLCDDGNACTIDACDDTETCLVDHPQVDCDDGLLCTTDNCDPTDGCQYAAIACNDGNECTVDMCNPLDGQCTGTPIDCGALGVCLPGTGLCDFPCDGFGCDPIDQCHEAGDCILAAGLPECMDGGPVADGTPCDDGDAGTTGDQCTTGVCEGQGGGAACPCEGLTQGVATWGSSFPTKSCIVADPTTIILFGSGDFKRLAALGNEAQFNCNVWDGSPQANVITYVTAAEAVACVDSVIAIAAEDGVVCN